MEIQWGTSRVLALFLVGVGLLSGCAPSGPQALLKGQALIHEGKYEPAVEMLLRATAALPQNAQAWNHLGLAYHGARQFVQAREAYEQALTLDRNLMAARYNLGCLFLDQNEPAPAIPQLASFCVMQPNSPEGWLKLGLAQLQVRQYAEAGRCLTNSIRLQAQDPEAWNGLGLLQMQRNRPREAMLCFATALQRRVNYGPALLNQAILYHQHLKNRPLALQRYREYLALKPPQPNTPAVAEIVQQLERELQPPPQRPQTNEPARLAAVTNRLTAHSNALTRVASAPNQRASASPSNAPNLTVTSPSFPLKSELPATSAKTGQLASSTMVPSAKTGMPTLPTASPPPSLDAAPPTTATVINEPVVKPPVDVAPESRTGSAASAASPPAAKSAMDSAVATTPPAETAVPAPKRSFVQRLNPLSWFRSRPKTIVTPLPLLANSTTRLTPGPGTDTSPAPLRMEAPAGSTNQPEVSSGSTPLRPQPVITHYPYRSPSKPAAGDRVAAAKDFARGVEAHNARQWPQAIEAYQKAIEADPTYFEAHYNLGLACFQAGRLPQALLEDEISLAINPHSFNARFNFALALEKANYPRDAANELERLLNDAPAETRLHLLVANLYAQALHQPQLAREHYLAVLELDPRHPQAAAIRYWLAANP